MALGIQNYNGGTTDEYGTNLVLDRFIGAGVVEGLLVQANASPNMTVYVQPGTVAIATGTYPSSYNYRAHIDTALPGASVTIATAAASPRIDYIVAYVDKTVAGSTAGANVNNTNAVLKLADVQGTPAGSPPLPTVAQIQATIGASNPYFILAQIAVGASVSTITNTNITDMRTFASTLNPKALGVASYVDNGGVTSFTASTLNGAITAGMAYINISGVLVPQSFNALSYTVGASRDTYFYVTLGNSTIQNSFVTTGNARPALPANSVWLSKVVSGASIISRLVDMRNRPGSNLQLPVNFKVSRNAAYSSVGAATTKLPVDTVLWDQSGNVDITNNQFIAPVDGYYNFTAGVGWQTATSRVIVMIYVNGVERGRLFDAQASAAYLTGGSGADDFKLNADDFVDVRYFVTNASLALGTGETFTWLSGKLTGRL